MNTHKIVCLILTLTTQALIPSQTTSIDSNTPLYSQSDANKLCPSTCGKKKWTGRWSQAPLNPDSGFDNGSCECIISK